MGSHTVDCHEHEACMASESAEHDCWQCDNACGERGHGRGACAYLPSPDQKKNISLDFQCPLVPTMVPADVRNIIEFPPEASPINAGTFLPPARLHVLKQVFLI
jgi:hypothetical protein